MASYLIKRVGVGIIITIIAVVLLYGMIHMVPGDPLNVILGPRATPEMKAALRTELGLDRPLVIQIGRFLTNVFQGNLGTDLFSKRPVLNVILEQLPYTIHLVLFGMGGAILLGIPLGCFSSMHRNSFLDKFIGILSVGTIAIPPFVVAIYSLLLFAVTLKWLPAIGAGDSGNPWDILRHLILPGIALGLGWVGYIARLLRASMLEVLNENHLRTARAFGLPEYKITFRYTLKLSVLPTVALLGVSIGSMMSSAVFAEIVFSRPGIGKLIYDAVITRNYPLVMGGVLVTTFLFVLSTMCADIVTAILDPRVRENL